jgi:DNA-binding MarR family transcriptional regulator
MPAMVDPVPTDPVMGDQRVCRAVSEYAPDADLDALMTCFNLIRAADRLNQDLEINIHRPAGLTWAAFRLLFAARSAGPLTPLALSRLINVTQGTVSSGLNNLERHGLLRREPSPEDGRSVTVHLTEAGTRVLAEMFARNNAREIQWAAALTPSERRTLVELLRKFRSYEPPPVEPGPRVIGEATSRSVA